MLKNAYLNLATLSILALSAAAWAGARPTDAQLGEMKQKIEAVTGAARAKLEQASALREGFFRKRADQLLKSRMNRRLDEMSERLLKDFVHRAENLSETIPGAAKDLVAKATAEVAAFEKELGSEPTLRAQLAQMSKNLVTRSLERLHRKWESLSERVRDAVNSRSRDRAILAYATFISIAEDPALRTAEGLARARDRVARIYGTILRMAETPEHFMAMVELARQSDVADLFDLPMIRKARNEAWLSGLSRLVALKPTLGELQQLHIGRLDFPVTDARYYVTVMATHGLNAGASEGSWAKALASRLTELNDTKDYDSIQSLLSQDRIALSSATLTKSGLIGSFKTLLQGAATRAAEAGETLSAASQAEFEAISRGASLAGLKIESGGSASAFRFEKDSFWKKVETAAEVAAEAVDAAH